MYDGPQAAACAKTSLPAVLTPGVGVAYLLRHRSFSVPYLQAWSPTAGNGCGAQLPMRWRSCRRRCQAPIDHRSCGGWWRTPADFWPAPAFAIGDQPGGLQR